MRARLTAPAGVAGTVTCMDHARNGYRLAEGVDLFDFTAKLREVLNPMRDMLDARHLVHDAVRRIDLADVKGEPRPPHPLLDALHAYDAAQDTENARGYRQAAVSHAWDPHSFEVAFLRDEAPPAGGTGRVLAILYTERPELRKAWEDLEEVERYMSSMEDLDDTDAVDRAEAWARVSDYGPVANRSITFQLRSPLQDTGMLRLVAEASQHIDLLTSVMPTRAKRSHDVALDEVTKVRMDRTPDADVVQVVWRHMRADLSPVVSVVAGQLDADVLNYLLNPDTDAALAQMLNQSADSNGRRHAIDTAAIRVAAEEWVTEQGRIEAEDRA